ncbi:MAG: SOS response-associated peptidase [Verrucomicrobiia bacterium]
MCSRYTLAKDEVKIIIGDLEIVFGFVARFNIAPSQKAPVLIEDSGGVRMCEMKWGWKHEWGKQLLINAQAETIKIKPTFKPHLQQRCLIPADGFYEWLPDKTPIRFTKPHRKVFCFAGLWRSVSRQKLDEPIQETSFVILTTTPNETVSPVHNRMPLIVQPEHYGWWLRSGELWQSVLNFPDRESLVRTRVNRAVNNPRNEGPEMIRSGD